VRGVVVVVEFVRSCRCVCVLWVVLVWFGSCVRERVHTTAHRHTQSLMSLLGVSEARSLIRDLWVRFVLSLHLSKVKGGTYI
jgi:hypothetical protein